MKKFTSSWLLPRALALLTCLSWVSVTSSALAGVEDGGLSFRLAPLIGGIKVRSRVLAEHQEPNRTTLLNLPRDENVGAYGLAARAGWAWPVGPSHVMVGLAYSFARGDAEGAYSTALDTYRFTLRPRYDSVGLVLDTLLAEGLLGIEMVLGTGRVDGSVNSELQATRGTQRQGHLLAVGIRGRFPSDSKLAVSLGMHCEVLGFLPKVFDQYWYSGALLSVRFGLEFDAARGGDR